MILNQRFKNSFLSNVRLNFIYFPFFLHAPPNIYIYIYIYIYIHFHNNLIVYISRFSTSRDVIVRKLDLQTIIIEFRSF